MILIPLSVVLHNNQKEKTNKPTINSQKYKHNTWFVQLKVTEIN